MHNSIFDLDEDFDSKEDFLLYFVAMQQKINCFQEIMFQKKSLAMIILAFKIEYLGKFTFEAKIEIAIIKKGDFRKTFLILRLDLYLLFI